MNELTSSQLSEWEAYDRLEPIGEWRADYRLAYLCSLVTNIIRALYPKKGQAPKMTDPTDFMLEWDRREGEEKAPVQQSVEEMKKELYKIASTNKKKKEREKKLRTAPPKDKRKDSK